MKKISMFVLAILVALSAVGFAETKSGKLIIPKTGMMEKPIEFGDNIIAFRDRAVIVVVEKDTKISKTGMFLMTIHIMQSEKNKNQEWLDFVNASCSTWNVNGNRLPVSPIQVDEIIYNVAINETDATWKIYGMRFYDISGKTDKLLYSATDSKNNHFMDEFAPLEKANLIDAAYRKVIQWHKEH